MIDHTQVQDVIGTTAYDQDGDKLGKVGQVFLDDRTGQPAFATVNTGLFGTSESFVPVDGASFDGDRLTLPYAKDVVKDAPHVELDGGHLDHSEEQVLYQHYGMTWSDAGQPAPGAGGRGDDTTARGRHADDDDAAAGTTGHDTSGDTTDDAMTRSEERLEVGTSTEEAGRVRLRKYVTTETETRTVPVRKEHAVLEREPITEANADDALDGPQLSEEEHEVVLHEERPVVDKTVQPVERVRLGTETSVDEETVTEDVRSEQIEADGDLDDRDGGTDRRG